jgi:hypothetical protein
MCPENGRPTPFESASAVKYLRLPTALRSKPAYRTPCSSKLSAQRGMNLLASPTLCGPRFWKNSTGTQRNKNYGTKIRTPAMTGCGLDEAVERAKDVRGFLSCRAPHFAFSGSTTLKRPTRPRDNQGSVLCARQTCGDLEQYPALAERAVAALVPRWAPRSGTALTPSCSVPK